MSKKYSNSRTTSFLVYGRPYSRRAGSAKGLSRSAIIDVARSAIIDVAPRAIIDVARSAIAENGRVDEG